MSSAWRIVRLAMLVGILVLMVGAPDQVSGVLHNLFALSNLAIFIFAAAVLVWFFYAVILRRILRARRIANARMKRLMREVSDARKDL
ncbi:MAG TPA: hypothetical protein VMT53_19460 [Terriglobales bacterium]|nr:hypothetical protein [Terriglobales bacterium]